MLDEIFASEMLARVWTAVLVARDRRWKTDETEAIARNVLDSHLEARRRALALLLSWDGLGTVSRPSRSIGCAAAPNAGPTCCWAG